jgi:DNA methylase
MRSDLALSCSGDMPDPGRALARTPHPTRKPLALVERAIRNSRKTRDIVLDRFAGSGSILMAPAKANRQARADRGRSEILRRLALADPPACRLQGGAAGNVAADELIWFAIEVVK